MIVNIQPLNKNDNEIDNENNTFQNEEIRIITSNPNFYTSQNEKELNNKTLLSNSVPPKIREKYKLKKFIQEQTKIIQDFKQSSKKKMIENALNEYKYLDEYRKQDITKFKATDIKYEKYHKVELKKIKKKTKQIKNNSNIMLPHTNDILRNQFNNNINDDDSNIDLLASYLNMRGTELKSQAVLKKIDNKNMTESMYNENKKTYSSNSTLSSDSIKINIGDNNNINMYDSDSNEDSEDNINVDSSDNNDSNDDNDKNLNNYFNINDYNNENINNLFTLSKNLTLNSYSKSSYMNNINSFIERIEEINDLFDDNSSIKTENSSLYNNKIKNNNNNTNKISYKKQDSKFNKMRIGEIHFSVSDKKCKINDDIEMNAKKLYINDKVKTNVKKNI